MKNARNLSDEGVVKLVQKGNKNIYEEVVKRYQDKLLRYVSYIVQDHDKSEDVVQEVFIKVYVNLNSFNTKKKFSSWIYRIAHNEAINLIKRQKRQISYEENSWIKEIIKDKTNIEIEFEKKQAICLLKTSLDKLPVKYREALTLYYLEEKSYEEISDILRIAKGTVGTRISRGKKLLKNICQKAN
jgi:RNA polymerase sigma-70 factor (ECF subfamily)